LADWEHELLGTHAAQTAQTSSPKSQQFDAFKRERRGIISDTTTVAWRGKGSEVASASMIRRRDRHQVADPDASYNYDTDNHGNQQGYMVESEPAKPWKVDTLWASKEGKHMATSLLGVLSEHSLRTTGKPPKASGDLSEHSTRLVHNLADKGLIKAPKNEYRNTYGFDGGHDNAVADHDFLSDAHRTGGSEGLTDADLQRGGNFIRGALRAAKPKPEKWTNESLSERQPLVNARSQAGRFHEFTHSQEIDARSKQAPAPKATQAGLW
jgi:hypothetical protein